MYNVWKQEQIRQHLPKDGTVFGENPGVSWDPLDIWLATNEEDDVTSRLAFDQGVSVRIKKGVKGCFLKNWRCRNSFTMVKNRRGSRPRLEIKL